SHHAVLCTDVSHLYESECGAPEKFIGVKLIPVPHKNGKLAVEDLPKYLVRRGDQHSNQIKMISITQPTELGTVYTLSELQALREFCNQERLLLHIDGARLGNACYFLNCDFKDILKFSDVATVGGTKNGLLFGELVVIQRPELNHDFKFIRKQAMQLPSKTRFMASAFLTYLTTGLWRSIAEHQHGLAKKLAEALPSSITPRYPVESNAVFCCFPKSWVKPLREEFFFYVWDEHTFECRLMTSFCTSQEEIDLFATKLKTMPTEVNHE
ncbi:threonine aldolase, partial [bacterium]|nr:threonine aldolase [bacterium]